MVQRAKDRSFRTTSAGQEKSREGPWAEASCGGKGLGYSLGQVSRKGWMDRPGKGAPCLHGPLGQIARVGGLQLLFKQAGPHPGVHLSVYLYILPEYTAWGMMVGTAAAQRACGSSRGLCLAGDGSPLPLRCASDSGGRQALGRWNRCYLSSRGGFVAWKSTSLSFKIIRRMQMYKNDMLLIFVGLFYFFFYSNVNIYSN